MVGLYKVLVIGLVIGCVLPQEHDTKGTTACNTKLGALSMRDDNTVFVNF